MDDRYRANRESGVRRAGARTASARTNTDTARTDADEGATTASSRISRIQTDFTDYSSSTTPPSSTSPDDALCDGTSVGVRREELPEVVLKNHIVRARGAASRERSRSGSEESVLIREIRDEAVLAAASASVRALSALVGDH